ncbi:type IV secretory system conjugative DNA transfer family protein [Streptomyces collinus]|uniref:type IV secretory system conjugative DNA transfer family protein n=1 Tax=Streptomyces collinus TaxID=42684 RepID=UPI003791ECEB
MTYQNVLEELEVPSSTPGRVTLGRSQSHTIASGPLRPVLVLGPQRSRKTTSMIIPSLLEWKGPAVVTSVRTDVLLGSYSRRNSGGRVHVYEPSGRLQREGPVVGWNPLDDCSTWDGAMATSRALTEAGTLRFRDGQFWYGMAAQLLTPMLYAAAMSEKAMADVVCWVKTQEEFEVRSLLQAADAEEAIRAFDGMVSLDDRLRSSVYGTLMSALAVFDYQSVLDSANGGLNVPEFFDGGDNTLYICAPPDEQQRFAPLFTALIRRILREAYAREAAGEEMPPLLLLLDEAGNIAPLGDLPTLATTAAGTGIQLVTVFHDLAQMVGIYGEADALTIVNNHSALLLLPGNRDPMTARLLSDLLAGEVIAGPGKISSGRNSLRGIQPGNAVCIYEHHNPFFLKLRSSTHDPDMLALARTPHERPANNVVPFRRAPRILPWHNGPEAPGKASLAATSPPRDHS